ncbi:MAG: metallophosphoesterase, partial [Coprobacillaceae bacterium]
MKKARKVLVLSLIAIMIGVSLNVVNSPDVVADSETESVELVTTNMNWTYLDDLVTDPNAGTWYESWNKKNGWTYPLEWKDWGQYLQGFSDEDWKSHTGSPKFSTDVADTDAAPLDLSDDGKAGPTYFFRHIFELENPEDIKTIKVTVRYNDAMILYLNGKPLESFFNIPTSNYTSNLQYGSQVKVTDKYIEETLYMEDVSSLVDIYNPTLKEFCIAAEVHCSDANDTDAYFELISFELNPDKVNLPESEAVKNVAVNVGEDENSVNFAWFATSNIPGEVQIAEGTSTTGAFPETTATTITSTQSTAAYTKFYDVDYYSNKATYNGIEPGKNYIYRVGNDGDWSDTYCLKTTDISDGSYEVIFLSDAQVGTGTIPTDKLGWKNTLESALGKFPNASFIANTGDFVDVASKESEYDAYFSPTILNQYPTATAVGNHDIAKNYGNHFNEPNMSSLGTSAANSDYYYTYGNVLYMVLNTSNTNHAEHVQFMEETIEATADQEFAWKVVMFHQSIYASGKQSTSSDVPLRREVLVPAFDELGVDIVLMGHDHCYARTHQMYNFEPVADVTFDADGAAIDPSGTVYLTTSSASGSKYYDLETDYEYLAYREQSYVPTFSHLTFSDDTFTMTAYRTDTMEVFDSYSIKKTVETEAEYVLQVNDVEIGYEEILKMSAEDIIARCGAKVINTITNEEVDVYDITVDEEALEAVKKAPETGGSYEITITATEKSLARAV